MRAKPVPGYYSSREALKQVEQSEPDLAIVGVDLAGEDGIVLMKVLKQEHAGAPVFLFEGLSRDDDTILRFIREGAFRYARARERWKI